MEPNYELKHNCLLLPLKVVLLALTMVLFGFTTYAQQGKVVRVANDTELIEAMENPSIGTVVLGAGYYTFLNVQVEEGARLIKNGDGNGSRDDCTFFIINNNVCFNADPGTYVPNVAVAGTTFPIEPTCPADNTGLWTVEGTPPGNVQFIDAPTEYFMNFQVDQPGFYSLRYTWAAYNTFVETEYYFYGPVTIDLSAPDVCEIDGLSTTVHFDRSSTQEDPNTTVTWTLNGVPYDGPTQDANFTLIVPTCGLYELCVTIDPLYCPPETECITIEFSCEPVAEAAGDNVCALSCADLYGSATVPGEVSPSFAYSWVNLSGPQDQILTFNPQSGTVPGDASTEACRDAVDLPDVCPYGEYEVQL